MINEIDKKSHEYITMRIAELIISIKESEKEILEIQHACSHPKESMKIKDMNKSGISDIRKTCGICKYVLGYPSNEEMNSWMNS